MTINTSQFGNNPLDDDEENQLLNGLMANQQANAGRDVNASVSPTLENEGGNTENAQDPLPEVPKLPKSEKISKEVNQKIQDLLVGFGGLREFVAANDNNADFKEFLKDNHDEIKNLLNTPIKDQYQRLVQNGEKRDQFYQDLIKNNVIQKNELNKLLGVVSPVPYKNFIKKLSQRNPEHGHVTLTEDDRENLDQANAENISEIIERLKGENKISDAEADKLINLGPKTKEEIEAAKKEIIDKIKAFDEATGKTYSETYESFGKTEEEIAKLFDEYIERYNKFVHGLVRQMEEFYDQDQKERHKREVLRNLKKDIGLELKVDSHYIGESKEIIGIPDGVAMDIDIKEISFEGEEPIEGLDQEIFKPTFEPFISFTVKAKDGSDNDKDLKMSLSSFKKFLTKVNLREKIDLLEDLEGKLSIPGHVKPGAVFEFMEYAVNRFDPAHTDQVPQQIQVIKIENGTITLSDEIIIGKNETGEIIKKKELDYGEFARWYNRMNAVPQIENLKELDKLLAIQHREINREMGADENYGKPIKLSGKVPPFYFVSAYDPGSEPIQVNKVDNEGLQTIDGKKIPFNDFYRMVKDKGLINPTKEQLKELEKIAEIKQDADKIKELKQMQAQNDNNDEKHGKPVYENIPGSPQSKKPGFLKTFWDNTHFLNAFEAYQLLIKAPTEKMAAYFKDKSERKVAAAGKDFWKGWPSFLGSLSGKYEDELTQKALTDANDVEKWMDSNIAEMKEAFKILYKADKVYKFRGALQFLSKKGLLRWEDDKDLWKAINKHLPGQKYPPHFHDLEGDGGYKITPFTDVEVGDKLPLTTGVVNYIDQCRAAIDGSWGTGVFDSLEGANSREYQGARQKSSETMREKEFMQGGIVVQLQKKIDDFSRDKPVNIAEFEGLLSQAIVEMETRTLEQGIMFFIAAFSVTNSKGQSLLPFSRLEPLIGATRKHLVSLYFAAKYPQYDNEGNPIMIRDQKTSKLKHKEGKFSLNNFKKLYKDVVEKDIKVNEENGLKGYEKYTAGINTINWIQREMLRNSIVKGKIGASGYSSDIDDKIYHYIGPNIKAEQLDRILSTRTDSMKNTDVLRNMYVGYSNQLKIKAGLLNSGKSADENKELADEFASMVYGYLYFNNTLSGRINKNRPFARMDDVALEAKPLADKGHTTKQFADKLEDFGKDLTQAVISMSGDAKLSQLSQRVFTPRGVGITNEQEEHEFRQLLYKNIVKLAMERPEEMASMAIQTTSQLVNMTGAQMTQEDLEKMKQSA